MDTDEPVYLNLGTYGIPDKLFGPIAQDLAICVGLVTMLGALAEGKVENLWMELFGKGTKGRGPSPNASENIGKCRDKVNSLVVGDEADEPRRYEWLYRERMVRLLNRAEAAFEARNELVHRVWSVPNLPNAGGYKTPPPKKRQKDDEVARPWRDLTVGDFRVAITEFAEVINEFDRNASSSPMNIRYAP